MIYDIKLTALKACLFASLFPLLFIYLNKRKALFEAILILLILLGIAIVLGNRGLFFSILGVFIYFRYNEFKLFQSKYFFGGILVIAVVLIAIKFDSIIGRLFIWRNIFNNISSVPTFGFGQETFKEIYSEWQSLYFKSNTGWGKFHLVADSPSFAFNEFLHYYIEFGVMAFALLGGTLFYNIRVVIKSREDPRVYFALSNLIILFFSFSSYPFHSIWINFLFIFNHVILIVLKYFKYKFNVGILAIITFAVIPSYLYKQNKIGWEKWEEAQMIPFNFKNEKNEAYEKAYKMLQANQYFLNDYCGYLLSSGSHDSAIIIAKANKRYMNQYELSMLLGRVYYEKKDFALSKSYFIKANNTIPNRFLPLAHLMEIEVERNNLLAATTIAKRIIDMPVKIPSTRIALIKEKAKRIIEGQ